MIKRNQKGFTLFETLIALAITSAAGIAALGFYQSEMQDELDNRAVKMTSDVVSSYKRFRAVNHRNPNNIAELLGSDFYTGTGQMPWGSAMGGAANPSGRAFGFSFAASDPAQATRLAGALSKYNATAVGTLVSLSAPMPTIETISNQMLCRQAIPGVPECNQFEVDLDVNNNDLDNIGNFVAATGNIGTFTATEGVVDNLVLQNAIALGANSISWTGNQVQFNADETQFSGDMLVEGNIVGNNSNISGINRIDATDVIATNVTIDDGTISQLQGAALDYDSGNFTDVTATNTNAQRGTFGTANATTVNATTTTTDTFDGQAGSFTTASVATANGTNLGLTGTLNTDKLDADVSSLGQASGSSLQVAGQVSAGSFVGGPASFTSVAVSGNVSGANFSGNNFTTSVSSVNYNKQLVDQNSSAISANRTKASQNSSGISSNASGISRNSSDNTSNRSLANSNTSAISGNTSRINTNTQSVSRIDGNVAALSAQWSRCVSAGGCQ